MESVESQEPFVATKSIMFVPICAGNHTAAAVLDYLYTRFKFHREFALALHFEQGYSKDTCPVSDDYLSIDEYPDRWLHLTLGELRKQASGEMHGYFWAFEQTHIGREVLIESIQLLQAKGYICVEDWGLFNKNENESCNIAVEDYSVRLLTCWVYLNKIDTDMVTFYRQMCSLKKD